MGAGGRVGVAGQDEDPAQAQVAGGAHDPLALGVQDDDGAGAGELLDEPGGAGAHDDADAVGPGPLPGGVPAGGGAGAEALLGGVHAHGLVALGGHAAAPTGGEPLEGDDVPDAGLGGARVGQGRIPRVPGGRQGQRRGMEVVDAHLAGAPPAGQGGPGGVGVDVDLVEAHAEGVGGADDAHAVADLLQLAAQLGGLGGGGLQQVHDLELARGEVGGARAVGLGGVGDAAGGQVGEHLPGDLGVGGGSAVVLRGRQDVGQGGEQQHEGRSPGVDGPVPQARGLHHGFLGPQGGGGGEIRDRGRSVQLAARQGRAGGGRRIAGDGEQGPGHGAGDGGPGAGGDLIVDADQFDGLQTGRVGGLGAHVRQRRQGLGDQEPGVAAGAPHGAVGRGAGGLGHIGALRQERQGVGGRAQGEQHVGAGVGVRNGEDVEGVDELARLLRGGHRQGEPVADRPGVQQASPLLGSCAPRAGSVAVEHLVLLLSWAGHRR